MNKFKIVRDDLVVVTAGKHKGKVGKVLKVHRADALVTIEKINLVKRKLKPNSERAGGVVEKEAPLHISNVALWNADENRRVKVGFKFNDEGKKVRFDKKTNAIIG